MLLRRLTRAQITAAARATGQRSFRLELPVWGRSTTSAIDQVTLFARLDAALPQRHRRFARTALRSIVSAQRWGIPRVSPEGWAVMFKGGWGSGTGRITSQAARLESRGGVWTVAVLTEHNLSHRVGVTTVERVAAALIARGPC